MDEDEEEDCDVGEIPRITSAASNDDSGIISSTSSTHTPNSHSSVSRCSSRRSFQDYMMGKMQKSLELERQLIFGQHQQKKSSQNHSHQNSQPPPLQQQSPQYQSPKSISSSSSSSSSSQNNMIPSDANFFASGGHSCSSSPSEPATYAILHHHQLSTTTNTSQQQQQQQEASSPARSAQSADASLYWTTQQQQQHSSSATSSPAMSTKSASTAATSSTSKRLLATTTALVATAEEQLLRVHPAPSAAATVPPQPSLDAFYSQENAAVWNNEMMDKMANAATYTITTATTADDDEEHHHQQQTSVRKKSVSSANTTFASTTQQSSPSCFNNSTVSSSDAAADADVPALRRASCDKQESSAMILRHDCPDMQQHRLFEESWDDAVQSTSRLHEQQQQQQQQQAFTTSIAHAASRRLNQHDYPLASTSASTSASFGVTAATGGGIGIRGRRTAALNHIQAGRGQRQQQLILQQCSPQRRMSAPSPGRLAAPSHSPRQLERQAVATRSPLEEEPQQQRRQLPVQRKVAIMQEQLQQQLTAKPRNHNQNPVGGASTTPAAINCVSSPPREQQQLAMVIQSREQQQQISHLLFDPPVSPQQQQDVHPPLEPPITLSSSAAAAASPLSQPPPLPPRQQQQKQQQVQQQLSPTSRALAARQVATNIERVRQIQLQQRQDRLYRPGVPQVSSRGSNNNNGLSGRQQLQQKNKPPPPPLPSLMSSVMSSVTLTTSSEPSANLDDYSMDAFSSSSASHIFQDENKQENDTSHNSHSLLHLNRQSDESDNHNDSSKDDSFWDQGQQPQQEQRLQTSLDESTDESNIANNSLNVVAPPKQGRSGGQNTNDNNKNETTQTATIAKAASASAIIIAPSMERGGGRLGARITANKMTAAKGTGDDDDDESNFSWGSLAPSHQVTTASAADTSNVGVVLSPAVASHDIASQMPRKENRKAMHQQGNVSEVAPFDSEITVISQIEEDDSLVADPRTVFSDPVGGETTNNGKRSIRRATWRRQGQQQQQEHELVPRDTYSPPPLMQTSSLISASEMSRRRTVTQDVLVTVGGVLDHGDLYSPLQEHQESFYHSSHILAYASPILSQHLRPTVGKNNYRLDLPRATSSEWKLLQQFLEPHSKTVAGVSTDNLPTLLPWFHELQLDILLKQCDELLCTLDIVGDRGIGEDDDDEKFSAPSAKDWGDLLTLAEICTLCSLPECHKTTLKAVQFCLVRHPGLCLDLQVLNQLTRLLQGNIATCSTLFEILSPYLPDELVLETRTTSQVQQLVCNTLFPYLLREGLREAVTLLDEERNRQVETERLLRWRQCKKELESMGDDHDHDPENSANTSSNDLSNSNSILQSNSTNSMDLELENGRPATPPSRDEILLSRSFNDDLINHRSNSRNTPITTNNSSYPSSGNSGTGNSKLDFSNIEYSFNSNDTSASTFSQSSRLMRKLERANFGMKPHHIDSISGDIQRKINSDPFRGYVELHHNIAEWWESWKEGPHHEYGKDEQRQDEWRNEHQRAQFKQQTDKSSGGVPRNGRSDTARQSTNSSSEGSSAAKRKGNLGKSSPTTTTTTTSMSPIHKGRLQPANRTAWLDLILQRLKRPSIFPSPPVLAEQQPPNQHSKLPITHRQPSVVTSPGGVRRTFAC